LADNPLLPQHRLRELHALMLRVRKLECRSPQAASREALLAATLLHLLPGDILSAPEADRTLRELAPQTRSSHIQHALPSNLRLPLCAGAARGMQSAAHESLVVAFAAAAAPEPGWSDAITWAHRDQLPLLLVITDAQTRSTRTRANSAAITWPSISRLAHKLRMPLFPVDGDDAVAVFRVIQETSARARAHGGPSVLWAVMKTGQLPPHEHPLARLESWLATRGISLDT
jgi:pyruvate dehydrogenase E1 component alpha subunit